MTSPWAEHWRLDPSTTFLNHGSFGISPQPVRAARRDWLRQLESQPMEFFLRVLQPALVWLLAWQLRLPEQTTRAIVLMAAAAPGLNAYLFASMYSRGQDSAASAVLLATLLSVFSISAWLVML